MSNHDIEDVLSSIRRLVSEDLRPAPSRAVEPVVPEVPEVADKLLLTPALRVVTMPDVVGEPAAAEEDAAAEPVWADADDTAAFVSEAAPVEDVVARLGAAVAEEEWESPFGDPQIWPDVAAPVEPRFVHQARVPLDAMPDDFSEAPMADFTEEEEAFAEPRDHGPAVRAPLRQMTPPQDDSAWADAAEAAVRADLAQETEEEVISGFYEAQAGGVQFDEAVLRDLVRDLIREELSGTLGERITRNVRKLVRAEIARALALREFE